MKQLIGLLAAFVVAGTVGAADFAFDYERNEWTFAEPKLSLTPIVHGEKWRECGRLKGGLRGRLALPEADGRYPCEIVFPTNGLSFAGHVSGRETNGVVTVAAAFTAHGTGTVETVSLQGPLDLRDWGKITWTPIRGGAKTERFRVASADGAKFLDLAFSRPIAMEFNRRGEGLWGLRLSLVRHVDVKDGDAFALEMTVRSHVPYSDLNRAWTARPGADWIPLTYKADIVPGSVLDLSDIVPRAPCGTYGRLRAKGGHFEFDGLPGVRQKFFGMNLHSFACYYTMEEARRLTDLFVRCGYNAVRFHNFENEYMGLTKDSPDEATPVEARFEGLDNLVEACRERGLYITIDLHIGRRTTYRALGIDKPGLVVNSNGMKGEMKYQYLVNPAARENFKRFVRGFFAHVNPHTGRRYADEPTLALVSVVNESPCCWGRYGKDHANGDLCDLEYDLMREMRAFIRDEVKSDVPLTTCNGGSMPFCLQPMRDAFCDYVDDHFYFDHPRFLAKSKYGPGGQVPVITANRRHIAASAEIPAQALTTRLWGKPYVVTEFNWCAPSIYRGAAGLLFGAFSGAQDWDGMWRYLWAHDHDRALNPGRHLASRLESASDPVAMAADRAIACLFLRGDMAPLGRKAALVMKRGALDVTRPHDCVWQRSLGWPTLGWYAQLGTAMDRGPEGSVRDFAFPADVKLPLAEAEKAIGASALRPGDGAVTLDRAANALTLATPRTCGGSVEGGAFTAGPLTADCGGEITTLWASAMDGRDVAHSGRILVTHLTNLHNDGDQFADRNGKFLTKFGSPRYLLRRARAEVGLALAAPERAAVYALGTDGARRCEVPAAVRDGKLVFVCDVARDPSNATFLYEVVCK